MKKVVLFDFHNTLATCDRWLELEIKTLPGLALRRLVKRGVIPAQPHGATEQANALFKETRQRVRESGVELSALEGVREVCERMGLEVSEGELFLVVEELELECLPDVEMIPGAYAALERLRDDGYRLGVVSSAGFPPFVELGLEALGLRAFFSEVITSTGEGLYKSNPEIFRRAVERLAAQPQEAVHVGDHALYDVRAARSAGLTTIWFIAEAERTARLHGLGWEDAAREGAEADAVIHSLDELYDCIKRMP